MSDDGKTPTDSYGGYLGLDKLLDAQHTRTKADSELLFIVIHQSNELWFKLVIHELENAIDALYAGRDLAAYKILSRVHQIQLLLIRTWDVLSTLTPSEYRVFRDSVGRGGASGFQSAQNREIEFLLGEKARIRDFDTGKGTHQADVIAMHANPDVRAALEARWRAPSIYDAAIDGLARSYPDAGITPRPRDGDYSEIAKPSKAIFEQWQAIYADPDAHMAWFQLGERLVDLEDALRRWRWRHLTTVARVIGQSTGTGGSAGLRYLQKTAVDGMENFLYPELWQVRNEVFSA